MANYGGVRERFEAKYIPEPNSGCWLWEASASLGYGKIWVNVKLRKAHRVSYELFRGEVPEDMDVCHKCDNTYCVNPDHLFVGTAKDNIRDCIDKGRFVQNTNEYITNETIKYIRTCGKSSYRLAKDLGINQSYINKIQRGLMRNA